MATSPLAAALMTGGESAPMLGMDPAVMQAMPDIQLGGALQQEGLSTAPASPMQALARVIQAGTGTYLKNSATSELAKAYANVPQHLANILKNTQPGNPVIGMLESDDPAMRMMGMQLAQKTVPLQSELQRTNPNQTVSSGTQPVFN